MVVVVVVLVLVVVVVEVQVDVLRKGVLGKAGVSTRLLVPSRG